MSCSNNTQPCNEALPCCDTSNYYCYEDTVCVANKYVVVAVTNYIIIIFFFLICVMATCVVYTTISYRRKLIYSAVNGVV